MRVGSSVVDESLRNARLTALGVTPMRLRANATRPSEIHASDPVAMDAERIRRAPRLRLWFPPEQRDPRSGPQARLLQQILRSVGVDDADMDLLETDVNPDGVRVLGFGSGAPAGAVRLPTLDRLRDPLEKRIAWPLLRRLRRQLRQADSD